MAKKTLTTRKYFRTESVVVKYPGQAKPVQVQRLALPTMASIPVAPGGFKPFRLVINLKVLHAGQPGSVVSVFDPPIEVRIRYTEADLASAKKAGKPLSLGFWDGKQWVRCTPELHQFHLEHKPLKKYVGWGVVRIAQWGDPIKAWGT